LGRKPLNAVEKSLKEVEEKLCVYCGVNPVPYLENGIQSTWIDNCDDCSKKLNGKPEGKRGVRKGQKLHRNKYYRVYVMGGLDEKSGEPRVLFDGRFRRFERQACVIAKKELKIKHGLYAVVMMCDESTDKQYVVARYEWETAVKVANVTGRHLLKTQMGDG
jgi:hypothetical protein